MTIFVKESMSLKLKPGVVFFTTIIPFIFLVRVCLTIQIGNL